jgi:hypothetical protein
MALFFSSLREKYVQILGLGGACSELECVHMALRNLPSHYENVKDNLLDRSNVTLVQAELALLRKERDVKMKQGKETETAMASMIRRKNANKYNKPKGLPKNFDGDVCWECGDPDHIRPHCAEYKERMAGRKRENQAQVAQAQVAMGGMTIQKNQGQLRHRLHVEDLPY